MPDPSPTSVVTGKVRLSYVHVFEAYSQDPDKTGKFSTMILVPKSDKRTVAALRAAEKAAAEAGKAKFNGRVPSNLASIIHDGDTEADLEVTPEREGHLYLTVSSKTKPGIVDVNVNPIMDPTEVYSGCYARVALNAYAYNTNGNKGISFGLNHLQKLEDGEPLDGRTRAEDVFSAYAGAEDSLSDLM